MRNDGCFRVRTFLISCCANQDTLAELIAAANILSNFGTSKRCWVPTFALKALQSFVVNIESIICIDKRELNVVVQVSSDFYILSADEA
jgi:hypothetical protein